MVYVWVAVMTWLGALGGFFFKKSAEDLCAIWSVLKNKRFYFGTIFYAAGALLNIVLLHYMEYSELYPMGALTYIWSLLLSKRQLGEKITKKKFIGIAFICLGVFFLVQ